MSRTIPFAHFAPFAVKSFFDRSQCGELEINREKRAPSSFLGTFSQIFIDSPFIRFALAIYSTQFQTWRAENARPTRRGIHGGRAGTGD
jgi:hypothetical protein